MTGLQTKPISPNPNDRSDMAHGIIETQRLRLRPLVLEDVDTVIRLRTNPSVFYWRTPDTPEQAARWLKDRLADPLCLIHNVEILHEEASSNGYITIGNVGAGHLPEIGYVYDPAYWGRGYATEALQAWMASYWKVFPGGHSLVADPTQKTILRAETGPEAAGSRRVLQKCGFRFERQREEQDENGPVMMDCWTCPRPLS